MLITIFVVIGTILCFIMVALCFDSWPEWCEVVGIVFGIFGALGILACVGCCIAIIGTHANSAGHFAAYQTEKEILEYRLSQKEYLNDNNVGMTELMEDITEYNTNLTKAQHGLHNPWTSWFYADYVDDLEPIILGDVD